MINTLKITTICIGIVVILFFEYQVIINFPNSFDDFNLLNDLNFLQNKNSIPRIISYLFSFTDFPHKIFFTKIYLMIFVSFKNTINFKLITFLINFIQNIVFTILSYKILDFKKYSIAYLIPFLLLYFNLDCHFDNLGLMSSSQHFTSLVCILAYAYLINKNIFLGIIISFICPLVSGEGLIILPLTLIYLIIRKPQYLTIYIPLIILYLFLFLNVDFKNEIYPNSKNQPILISFFYKSYAFLAFLGGSNSLRSNSYPFFPNAILGFSLLVLYLITKIRETKTLKNLNFNNSDLIILSVIGMSLMVIIARGDGLTLLNNASAMRFKMYQYVFLIFVLYRILKNFPKTYNYLLIFSIYIFFTGNLVGLNNFYTAKSKQIADYFNYKKVKSFYSFSANLKNSSDILLKTNLNLNENLLDTLNIKTLIKFKNYSINNNSRLSIYNEENNFKKLSIINYNYKIEEFNKNVFLILTKENNIYTIIALNSFKLSHSNYNFYYNLNIDSKIKYEYYIVAIDKNQKIKRLEKLNSFLKI